jgi:predicted O-methyltransferase YrrM
MDAPLKRTCDFTSDYTTRHIPTWKKYLRSFAGKSHIHMLEIGTWEGRSACWFLQNILTHSTARITCIDTFAYSEICFKAYPYMRKIVPHLERRFAYNIRVLGAKKKVTKIKNYSQRYLRTLPLREIFDIVYIDGSHVACDILTDAVLCWPLLRTQGVLIFDDYRYCCLADPENALLKPKTAIDAFLTIFGDQLEILTKRGRQVLVRKTTPFVLDR